MQKTSDLEAAQKRVTELETQITDQSRELLTAKTELAAVEKDSADALSQLRATDAMVSESLKAELDRLREKHSFIISERDAQKSQLIEALLAKDKFRRDLEEGKDISDGKGADAPETSKKESEKVEKLRARLIERNEVSPDTQTLVHGQRTWLAMDRKLGRAFFFLFTARCMELT